MKIKHQFSEERKKRMGIASRKTFFALYFVFLLLVNIFNPLNIKKLAI